MYAETQKNKKYMYAGQISSLLFGIVFFFFLPENEESFEFIVFFILTLIGVTSFLFFAPYTKYLKHTSHNERSYYIYFYKISVIFFISAIV
jgi:hypothetical protein